MTAKALRLSPATTRRTPSTTPPVAVRAAGIDDGVR